MLVMCGNRNEIPEDFITINRIEFLLPRIIDADDDDGMNVSRINGIALLLK